MKGLSYKAGEVFGVGAESGMCVFICSANHLKPPADYRRIVKCPMSQSLARAVLTNARARF
jgi:hypothetical protein